MIRSKSWTCYEQWRIKVSSASLSISSLCSKSHPIHNVDAWGNSVFCVTHILTIVCCCAMVNEEPLKCRKKGNWLQILLCQYDRVFVILFTIVKRGYIEISHSYLIRIWLLLSNAIKLLLTSIISFSGIMHCNI